MKFGLYLFRWQLSTPILWAVVYWVGPDLKGTIIANFIGGCVFYLVDKRIFKTGVISSLIFLLFSTQVMAADRCISFVPQVRQAHMKYLGPGYPWKYGVGQLKQESACRQSITAFDGGMGAAQFMPKTSQYIQSLMGEKLNPYNPADATRMQAFYMARIYQKENPYKKIWWSYQVYNSGLKILLIERERAGEADWAKMKAVCARKKVVTPKGYILDFCHSGYDYSQKIYKYGNQYSPLESISFW